MDLFHTKLNDCLLLKPKVFADDRGAFWETWNSNVFKSLGIAADFVQDNQSVSFRGTLRGLHFQSPQSQGKLVWVVDGEVFDVAVDLRKSSSTFGMWQGLPLSSDNRHRLWIPEGFAHGFYVLSERASFCYKCTNYYYPPGEKTLAWNDPTLAIDWPLIPGLALIISDKDSAGLSLSECSQFFLT
jgi:dTDP-4-dehydrorhamnose 3,5-epimerase